MSKYDLLIIGAGLYGSIIAKEATNKGKKVLVIDKRDHIGGNCYTKTLASSNIQIHWYGPHIFHTNDKYIWDYINQFADFNHYRHHVKVTYQDQVYSFPINMMTFQQLWGLSTPQKAKEKIAQICIPFAKLHNAEEYLLSQIGNELYRKFYYGYTKKQWNREPKNLPASIVQRIPIRFTYNDNYYDDIYQGIPIGGYTQIFEKLLSKSELQLNQDYLSDKKLARIADIVIYTGSIDELFDFDEGKLEYRSLEFQHHEIDGDFQGVAQMNYTDENTKYTRIIEHKHFELLNTPKSIITYEYPSCNEEKFYPINNLRNDTLYQIYQERMTHIFYGGRLGSYTYLNMDQTIKCALELSKTIL